MPLTYVNIATTTLGSSSSLVTFDNISQSYTDLILHMSVRSTNGYSGALDQLRIWFNNNSSSTLFFTTVLQTDASAVTCVNNGPNANDIPYLYISSSGSTASTFGTTEVYIPNYASSANKQIFTFSAQERTGNPAYMTQGASLFRNTAAITRIDINSSNSMTLNAGSSFYLYGIKNS